MKGKLADRYLVVERVDGKTVHAVALTLSGVDGVPEHDIVIRTCGSAEEAQEYAGAWNNRSTREAMTVDKMR